MPLRSLTNLDISVRDVQRAEAAHREVQVSLRKHGKAARYIAEIDRLDSEAAAAALKAALDAEIGLMEYGLSRAQGSAARLELLGVKVEMLARLNNERFQRRFLS